MQDTNTAIDLVEQSRAQIGKLAGGDWRIGIQAIIMKELSQVQTLEGTKHKMHKNNTERQVMSTQPTQVHVYV